MKTIFFLTSIFFAGQTFAGTFLCDRGDEWFQVLQSPEEVIACDWVGYGLCYEGTAADAIKKHFRSGEELKVENVGKVRIMTASVKRKKVEVIFDLENDGQHSLSISRCKL